MKSLKRYKPLAIVIASFGFLIWVAMLATGARAAGWTSCHMGAHAGMVIATDKATLGFGPAAFTVDSFGASSPQGGIGAGCDISIDRLVVGGFADWTYGDAETKLTLATPGGSATATQSIKDMTTVGARAGIQIKPDMLAYGLAGHTWARSSDLVVSMSGGGGSLDIGTLKGWTFGGGIESLISKDLSLKAEYRFTRFDSADLNLGGPTLKLEPEAHTIWVGVNWRFDGLDKTVIP